MTEYTRKLQEKERHYQSEKLLRDDQLAKVLRALLIFEARLRQEQKLISHQLREKDTLIGKQRNDIKQLLKSQYCKHCSQHYGGNLESLDSSSEYQDYESTLESLSSSCDTYGAVSESTETRRSSDGSNGEKKNVDVGNENSRCADLRIGIIRNLDARNTEFKDNELRNHELRNVEFENNELRNTESKKNNELRNSELRKAGVRIAEVRNAELRNSRNTELNNSRNAEFRESSRKHDDIKSPNGKKGSLGKSVEVTIPDHKDEVTTADHAGFQKNKSSLGRKTKKIQHRKSVGTYFEVLKLRGDSASPTSEDNTSNDYEALESLQSEQGDVEGEINRVSERIEHIFSSQISSEVDCNETTQEEIYNNEGHETDQYREGSYNDGNYKEDNYNESNYNEGNYNEGNYIMGSYEVSETVYSSPKSPTALEITTGKIPLSENVYNKHSTLIYVTGKKATVNDISEKNSILINVSSDPIHKNEKDSPREKLCKITENIPVFEDEATQNETWYASASDQEDDEQRDVYRNNPVLECMNQILLQNINSPPKTPNVERKNRKGKKVKFSDDKVETVTIQEVQQSYYETPIQKQPNFYETPQSIYSNDYEQILDGSADLPFEPVGANRLTVKQMEQNHDYVDMEANEEAPRKTKIARTPPALPPKPANLISKYKVQNFTKNR